MTQKHLHTLFSALNEAEVKFLIVGGLAVNAHGYQRFTRDVDLMLSLAPENLTKALNCLKTLSFRPLIPVSIDDFLDSAKRQEWIETKNLNVFSLVSDELPGITLDLFAENPFSFQEAYAEAYIDELHEGLSVPFINLERLIQMKQEVARPQDLLDVESLQKLRDELQD